MTDDLLSAARDVQDDFHIWACENPRDLAMREYVSVKDHRQMADWVRNLEMLVRRILWIMASAMKLEPVQPRVARQRIPGLRVEYPEAPESWRTPFRVIERRIARSRRSNGALPRPKPPAPRVLPSWPLARRLEAIRRVLAKPSAAASRLARLCERRRHAARNTPDPAILRVWDFTPRWRTTGKHCIASAMAIADEPSQDAFFALLRPRPG